MIISFSGTSGSGKSTIIAEIKKSGVFSGKKVIVKEEDSFVSIKLLKSIMGDNIFSKYKEEKFFKRSYNDIPYRFFSALSYFFYPLVVYIEFLIDYIKFQLLFKNTILITDRYIYDYEVSFKNVFGINNRVVKWFYNHPPKPYLSFLIEVDITTALKRNKNNIPGKITASRLFHENILSHYRKIAKQHNLLVIDSNNSLKDAVKHISAHIINKGKLLNAGNIAICGLDGTGKTTTANMLAKYATSLSIKSTVVHFYHENLLFKLLLLLGFLRIDEPRDLQYRKRREHSARERLKTTPFILAFLRFFDSYMQHLFSQLVNRGKLVIFDRYFYDYLVSFEYLNIRWRSFFSKFIPPSEHKFLLESLPLTSYERKPESVKEFFVECHQIYLNMAKEQGITIIKTDNKNPDYVMKELIESIN